MKRFLSVLLTLTLCISSCLAFTGCEQRDIVDPDKASELSIVMITDKAGLGDGAINDACWAGLQQAAKDHKNLSVDVVEATREYAAAIADAVKLEPDIILCVSGDMAGVLNVVASQYENEVFIIFDEELPDQFNVTTIKFNPEQRAYIAGAMAGLTTTKNVAGFIAEQASALNDSYLYGYTAGIVKNNNYCYVTTNYIGDGATERQAKETCVAQFKLGADVIFNALDTDARRGVLQAAGERGFKLISMNGETTSEYRNSILSCIQINGEKVAYDIAEHLLNGTFDGSTMYYNMSTDAYIINDANGYISEEQMDAISKVMNSLKNGSVVAPYDYNTYQQFMNGEAFASSDSEQIKAQAERINAMEAAASGQNASGAAVTDDAAAADPAANAESNN